MLGKKEGGGDYLITAYHMLYAFNMVLHGKLVNDKYGRSDELFFIPWLYMVLLQMRITKIRSCV